MPARSPTHSAAVGSTTPRLRVRIALGTSSMKLPGPRRVLAFRMLWAAALVLAWLALVVFSYRADPDHLSNRGIFFLLLYQALLVTCILVVYWLHRRLVVSKLYRGNLYHCSRLGALLATYLLFNVYLLTVRSWSGPYALVLLVAFALFELLALARK